MNFSDNTHLIEKLKKGDEKAFMYLVDTYHGGMEAYAISLINDRALAQDIVQNVFLRTWQFRKKLISTYSIQSFLYKSVYNEFLNVYKQNKAVTLLEKKYLESLSQVAESIDPKDISNLIAMVTQEIQNLPPSCKQIFSLSKKEGLTNREIAEHLNISIKTVEAQITKAFKLLRGKLEGNYEKVLKMWVNQGSKNLSD